MSTIASRAKICVDLFTHCVELLHQPDNHNDHGIIENQLDDSLGRFRIWAGNIGALQKKENKSSLDFRLREAPKIAIQISEVLDDLVEAISIISHQRDNRTGVLPNELGSSDDDGEEEISEIREILESIDDAISNLFRFSILLRNHTNRDRYAKANAAGGSPFNDWFDICHVDHKFPALRRAGKEWLIERLGKGITQRRQYLRYCREHREKTSTDRSSQIDQTPQRVLLAVPHVQSGQVLPPRSEFSKPPSTLAHTQASTFVSMTGEANEEELADDTQSQTSYATSIDEGSKNVHLRVIPIEDVSMGANHFECIYCWQIQIARSQKSWKKHVLTDLKPYVCTYEDCELKLFSDRHAWFSHELKHHRCQWQCHFCAHSPFQKASSYEDHLVRQHNLSISNDQLPAILEISQRAVTKVSPTDCPFCDDWEQLLRAVNSHIPLSESLIVTPSQFQHHVGSHMEQLALFAIPRGHIEKADAESGSAAAPRGKSDGTSIGEAEITTPDTAEDLLRCQDVLDLFLSSGGLSDGFKKLPEFPHFSMWLSPNDFVKVSPLDLGILSQRLSSGVYRTAKDFQLDVVLMFAMRYENGRSGEDLILTRSLFADGWHSTFPENGTNFNTFVDMVEKKMQYLFFTARNIDAFLSSRSQVDQDILIKVTMPNGVQMKKLIPGNYRMDQLYVHVECFELLQDIDNVPVTNTQAQLGLHNSFYFTVNTSNEDNILGPFDNPFRLVDINSTLSLKSLMEVSRHEIFVRNQAGDELPLISVGKGPVPEHPVHDQLPQRQSQTNIDDAVTKDFSSEEIHRGDGVNVVGSTLQDDRETDKTSGKEDASSGKVGSQLVITDSLSTGGSILDVHIWHDGEQLEAKLYVNAKAQGSNWVSKQRVAALEVQLHDLSQPEELHFWDGRIIVATSEVVLWFSKIGGDPYQAQFCVASDTVPFDLFLGKDAYLRTQLLEFPDLVLSDPAIGNDPEEHESIEQDHEGRGPTHHTQMFDDNSDNIAPSRSIVTPTLDLSTISTLQKEYKVKATIGVLDDQISRSMRLALDGKYIHLIDELSQATGSKTFSIPFTDIIECKMGERTTFEIYYSASTQLQPGTDLRLDTDRAPAHMKLDAQTTDLAEEIVQEIGLATVRSSAHQGLLSVDEMSQLISEHHGPPAPVEKPAFFMQALRDYDSNDIKTLRFRRGDVIAVMKQLEVGWGDGILNGERGRFPTEYCQVVMDPVGVSEDRKEENKNAEEQSTKAKGKRQESYEDQHKRNQRGLERGVLSKKPLAALDNKRRWSWRKLFGIDQTTETPLNSQEVQRRALGEVKPSGSPHPGTLKTQRSESHHYPNTDELEEIILCEKCQSTMNASEGPSTSRLIYCSQHQCPKLTNSGEICINGKSSDWAHCGQHSHPWPPTPRGLDPHIIAERKVLKDIRERQLSGNALCYDHYLRPPCPVEGDCPADHEYQPTTEELDALAYFTRLTPCIRGQYCDLPNCFHGHHCPSVIESLEGPVCLEFNCDFVTEDHPPKTTFVYPLKRVAREGGNHLVPIAETMKEVESRTASMMAQMKFAGDLNDMLNRQVKQKGEELRKRM